jgi:hypothetical protein
MSRLTLSEAFARLRRRIPHFSNTLLVDAHSISVGVISIVGRIAMNTVLVLLTVSALVGIILGSFSPGMQFWFQG